MRWILNRKNRAVLIGTKVRIGPNLISRTKDIVGGSNDNNYDNNTQIDIQEQPISMSSMLLSLGSFTSGFDWH